jgi:hypothetical protein
MPMRSILLAPVLLLACSSAPDGRPDRPAGDFLYSAMSATGQPLLTGHLRVAFPTDSTLTGTWTIAWLPGADTTAPVGPQVGSGVLLGSRSGDLFVVQLNPTYADNNVALLAVPTTDGYSGQWEWSTLAGPASGGAFLATPE